MVWHWVDYVILGIIALSVVTGLFRGFVKELLALMVWALALWLAFNYSQQFDGWLQPYIQEPKARTVVSFVAILLGTLIGGGLFNTVVGFILKRSGLSSTDRILGMGFGLVRGVFIVALLMLVVQFTSIPHEEYLEHSQLYVKFDPLVSWLSSFMPDVIQKVKTIDQHEKIIDVQKIPQNASF